jgi:hypothetical protein
MTSPIVTTIETAIAPELIAAIGAIEQFFTNIGTDPSRWALKLGPAQIVLAGQLGLQLPAAVQSMVGVGFADANALLNGWAAKLKALPAPAAV